MERAGHAILFFLCCFLTVVADQDGGLNGTSLVDVGVILDLDTLVGKMGMTSISMAMDDFYASHSNYSTRLLLHIRDSNSDVIRAASAALGLLEKTEVKAIIGAQTSAQAVFLSDLADKAHAPLLSFSATSPSLSATRYFVRTTVDDSSQAPAIAAIIKSFRWREAVPIYEDSDYGRDIIPFLVDTFQETNTHIPYRSVISMQTTDARILKELYKLKTMQTRVFIVHMSIPMASRLFLKANEAGMMSEGYVWILTDGLGNVMNSLGSSVIKSMQGVLGLRIYIPKSKKDGFPIRWQRRFQQENPKDPLIELNAFGRWAYDTAWALALAAEKVQHKLNPGFVTPKITSTNSTDLDQLGVSMIGASLLDAISETTFKGVSGEFRIINNQLKFSSYEIINVIGGGGRRVGVWISEHGIVSGEQLEHINLSATTSLVSQLKPVIWPGESTVVPKGWQIPTSGKKLRIGVPVRDAFLEFVRVVRDPITNETKPTGFCIDVFETVLQKLPYWLPHEYIPYEVSDGRGTYDDLIYQVHLQNLDAVVADTTIRANRSLYVDFTLPYTESGVAMIVPVKERTNNAWFFLKPLTSELWFVSLAFFFYIGLVVWLIEHRINDEFRGPLSQQLGTAFYFSFSMLVFAHRERVKHILSRVVVILWVFVLLVLTSSYTASLTSLITVEQLQPTVTDVRQLQKNGEFVGYHNGSFMFGLLIKQLNFDESKIRGYDSPEEYAEALSKGSRNGGVSAVVHEIPYIKLFLAKHCKGYTMIGPIYQTAGFGFVFPKGSPLVSDISQGILDVTEEDSFKEIEKKYWFKDRNICLNHGSLVTSRNLQFRNFWGLFLLTGSTSTCALLIFVFIFLYKNFHDLSRRCINWLKSRLKQLLDFRFNRRKNSMATDKEEASNVDYSHNGQYEFHVSDFSETSDASPVARGLASVGEDIYIAQM